MISLPKRSKFKFAIFGIFLIFSAWSYVSELRVSMYSDGRPQIHKSLAIGQSESLKSVAKPCQCSNAESLPTTTHPSKEEITESFRNNTNISIILKRTNTTLISLLSSFHAKSSEKPTTSEKQSPSAKPSIDIVNDYYPFVDFKFIFPEISPKVDSRADIFIVVLVNSGAKGDEFRKRRKAIRSTWGNQNSCEQRNALRDEKLKDFRWLLVFVVGKAGPETIDDELNLVEAGQHNDMLIGNITDNYLNNIIKFYMGLVWTNRFDKAEYILKTDDDVYVRIPRVVEYLVNIRFPKPFYGGWGIIPHKVDRVIGNKWAISWKYYGKVYFPWFNTGAFIFLSNDLLIRLLNYVYIRKPFHIDDAYVGLAMQDFGIKVTRMPSLFLMDNINKFLHDAEDCTLLDLNGFAHSMRPESFTLLHDRLSSLACGNKTIQC